MTYKLDNPRGSPSFLSALYVSADDCFKILLPITAAQELGLDLLLHLVEYPILCFVEQICM